MSFLAGLFGTKEAVSDFTDKDNGHLAKVGGWIGKLNFTKEEQAGHNLSLAQIGIDRLKALEPFKVMQRIMVTIIMIEWALIINCFLIAIMFKLEWQKDALMEFCQTEFAWFPVSAAVLCYLLGGVMPGAKK